MAVAAGSAGGVTHAAASRRPHEPAGQRAAGCCRSPRAFVRRAEHHRPALSCTRSGCLLRGTAPILPVDPHALWFGLLWCAWGDWLPAPGPPPRALVRGLATVPPPACRPPPIVAGVALACASLVAFGPVVLRALFLLGPHSVLVVLVAAAGEVPPATSCGWCSCALGSARAFRLVLLGFWRLLPRYPV